MASIVVLTLLAATSGGLLATLARQTEINRQMAVVDSEVGNALSLIHSAPFETIDQVLAADGFADQGGYVFSKDLSGAPTRLPNGRIDVAFRNVTGTPLPDPLYVDVTISWDMPPAGRETRTFVAVRTK